MAKNKSGDPSAEDFGYLGKVDLATLRPELREALHGVGPDQITNIVKVPGGYAILKVLAASEGAAGQGMGANRDLPLSGKSSIKYPVDVAGQVIADLAFQKYPKPAGWEQNFKAICEIRQKSLSLLEDRIKTRVHSPGKWLDPEHPVDLIQARYALAQVEAYQGKMDEAVSEWEAAYKINCGTRCRRSRSVGRGARRRICLYKSEMDNDVYRHPPTNASSLLVTE